MIRRRALNGLNSLSASGAPLLLWLLLLVPLLGACAAVFPGPAPQVTGQLIDGLDEAAVVLVDARTAERFEGAQEPIDAVAGHVPGAVNLPFTGNLGKDGRFLDAATLARRFRPLLDGPAVTGQADRIVHMCGSGVTACHNLLAMEVAGLSGSRLYVGSWSEWIADPDRPVATGN